MSEDLIPVLESIVEEVKTYNSIQFALMRLYAEREMHTLDVDEEGEFRAIPMSEDEIRDYARTMAESKALYDSYYAHFYKKMRLVSSDSKKEVEEPEQS